VFCRFDPAARYSVLATPGVIDIVRFGGSPAAIKNSEIEAVQLIVNSSAAAEPYADLVEGQRRLETASPEFFSLRHAALRSQGETTVL